MDNDLPLFDFSIYLSIAFITGTYDDKEFLPWGIKIPLLNMNFNLKNVQVEYFSGRDFCFIFNDFIYLNEIPLEAFQGNFQQLGPVWRKKQPTQRSQLTASFA